MNNAPFFGEHGYVPPAVPNFQMFTFLKSLTLEQIVVLVVLFIFLISGISAAINRLREQKGSETSIKDKLPIPLDEQEKVALVARPTPTQVPAQNTNVMPGVYAQIPMERMQEFSYVQYLNGYVHQSQYHLVPAI